MDYRVKLNLLIYNKNRSNHIRGSIDVLLPFAPSIGIHIQYKDMYPLQTTRVEWITEQECFNCIVEDDLTGYEFDMDTDIDELIDDYDVLRDAKEYGWVGFDKIFRDDW